MTLKHILVQRFKKKEMDEKSNFEQTHKCYKASKSLWKNDLGKSLIWHETNFESFSLKSLNIRGVSRTQSNIFDGFFLQKQLTAFSN